MNKAMLAIGIIVLAIFSFAAINLIQNFSTGNELDYYLLKETTDAAMMDALDYSFYANSGSVRMDKEKFAESFLRRFANNVTQSKEYDISFYDINETPPKVSVKVNAFTTTGGPDGGRDNLAITTKYDAVLEDTYLDDPLTTWNIKSGKLKATSN